MHDRNHEINFSNVCIKCFLIHLEPQNISQASDGASGPHDLAVPNPTVPNTKLTKIHNNKLWLLSKENKRSIVRQSALSAARFSRAHAIHEVVNKAQIVSGTSPSLEVTLKTRTV